MHCKRLNVRIMTGSKPKVIKDYEKLDESTREQIKLTYPNGFSENLISFTNKDGKIVTALPFETEEKYYLLKMSIQEAEQIIEDDDDYNDDGYLKNSVKEGYEDKYGDMDYLSETVADDDSDDSND